MSKIISLGERRLMAAVLLQSIEDFKSAKRKSEQFKAKNWLLSKDIKYLYSFESVCTYLERDSNNIRKKLGLISQQRGLKDR